MSPDSGWFPLPVTNIQKASGPLKKNPQGENKTRIPGRSPVSSSIKSQLRPVRTDSDPKPTPLTPLPASAYGRTNSKEYFTPSLRIYIPFFPRGGICFGAGRHLPKWMPRSGAAVTRRTAARYIYRGIIGRKNNSLPPRLPKRRIIRPRHSRWKRTILSFKSFCN